MNVFLTSLRSGGSCFTVEEDPQGFTLLAVAGQEVAFSALARSLADRVDPAFHVFLRSDARSGYDRAQIMTVD